jgi:hypothetical protein
MGVNLQFGADGGHALAHNVDAKVARRDGVKVKATAVVPDQKLDLRRLAVQVDGDQRRLSVLGHIV